MKPAALSRSPPPCAPEPPRARKRRGRRIAFWSLGLVAGLLLLLQFVGSPLITAIINRRLSALPGYSSRVEAVRLALWRGRITATNFVLTQDGHEAEGPMLKVARGSFSLAPLALLRGQVAGGVEIDDIAILIIPNPADAKKDKAAKDRARAERSHAWQVLLQDNFPFHVTRLEVSRLSIRFADPSRTLAPQVIIEEANLVAHDFTSEATEAGDLPSKLRLDGKFPGGGTLVIDAAGDSAAASPTFHATLEVKNLTLASLHDLLLACAHVEVKRGTFDLYVEATARGGHYNGYMNPLLRDLEFKSAPDPRKNVVTNLAIEVAGAAQDLLKSDANKAATKVPFHGDFADYDVDLWVTVENLLRTAFINALREGFQGQKQTG